MEIELKQTGKQIETVRSSCRTASFFDTQYILQISIIVGQENTRLYGGEVDTFGWPNETVDSLLMVFFQRVRK